MQQITSGNESSLNPRARANELPEMNAHEFEMSHGRRPSGRGSWGFCTIDTRRSDYLLHIIWINGPYGIARRAAQRIAAGRITAAALLEREGIGATIGSRVAADIERGVEELYVCS